MKRKNTSRSSSTPATEHYGAIADSTKVNIKILNSSIGSRCGIKIKYPLHRHYPPPSETLLTTVEPLSGPAVHVAQRYSLRNGFSCTFLPPLGRNNKYHHRFISLPPKQAELTPAFILSLKVSILLFHLYCNRNHISFQKTPNKTVSTYKK